MMKTNNPPVILIDRREQAPLALPVWLAGDHERAGRLVGSQEESRCV